MKIRLFIGYFVLLNWDSISDQVGQLLTKTYPLTVICVKQKNDSFSIAVVDDVVRIEG